MINLIFDLNNIAHRSMFIVGGYGSKTFTFDSQSEIDKLMRKMAIDIAFITRQINPSRIIFCQDDSSWRKDIKIDENDGYKANRVKTKMINWNNVYNAIGEFTDIMQNNGMIITKIHKAEADDLIALWAKELFEEHKQNVIIVSGDEDLRQLVKGNDESSPSFITVFNPFMQGKNASRKLYVSSDFKKWIDTPDVVDFLNLRNTINIDKNDFKKIVGAERTTMEVVDGSMIAMRKVFCGDDGDNIPAFHTWLNDKGKEIRVTNSKFVKMYEYIQNELGENVVITFDTLLHNADTVKDAFVKVLKFEPNFDVKTRLERQIKLVVLSPHVFPETITEEFYQNVKEKELQKPYINYSSINMQNLLEGTRYVTPRSGENESSIFKQIDRIQGSALF